MRRIVMCAAGAALVVGACASETTEPKTPAQAEQDTAEIDDGSGLSDEEFWAREEAKDAAEHNRIVHSILEKHGVRKVVKSKSMLTEECHLNPFLERHGIEGRALHRAADIRQPFL